MRIGNGPKGSLGPHSKSRAVTKHSVKADFTQISCGVYDTCDPVGIEVMAGGFEHVENVVRRHPRCDATLHYFHTRFQEHPRGVAARVAHNPALF